MRSLKIFALGLVVAVSMTLAGCSIGPAGAFTTPFTDSQSYPAANTSMTVYQLDSDDFEIKGTVEAEGSASTILFFFSSGDNGYASLMREARALGCDDVMNVRVDTEVTNYFFVYTSVKTRLTGQGVKWKI